MEPSQQLMLPDMLGSSAEIVEGLLALVGSVQPSRHLRLTMANVRFVRPYGAVVLQSLCRYLAQLTGHAIDLQELTPPVHAYLRRIDFFSWPTVAYTSDPFCSEDDFGRNPASTNVLEIVSFAVHSDVYAVADKAEGILSHWLGNRSHDIQSIVTMLAEACANVVDHSGDTGLIAVQKYDYGGHVEVALAVSDLGVGIRNSLRAVHPNLHGSCAGFIERALDGMSARPGSRGGQGLGAIRRIALAGGGSLYVRSETGAVSVGESGAAVTLSNDNLPFFPGTQVSIVFRSRA